MLDALIQFLIGSPVLIDGTPVLYAVPWLLPAIAGVSAIGNLISGSRAQGRANRANRRALTLANRRFDETSPFRAASLDALRGNLQGPNLDHIFGGSSNPFARPIRPLMRNRGPVAQAAPRSVSGPPSSSVARFQPVDYTPQSLRAPGR